MEHDLTRGSVSRTLLRFALPFMGASVLQFLYAVVDMIVVGRFSDTAAITAVNTSGQIMQLVTSIIAGITTGGAVLIGQYAGAQRPADVTRSIAAMFRLFVYMGLAITALLLCCSKTFISLMQVPAEAVAPARSYLIITGAGTLFITAYNGVSSILRGLGDSKRPLYFIACSCVLNILGDLLLVGGFGMGAAGAAYATVAAQAVSSVASLLTVRKSKVFDLSVSMFRPEPRRVRDILKLGVPVSAQDVLVTLSFVLITAIVNRMGLSRAAAVGVVERIVGFCMLVPGSFLSALSAFTAQNVGAGLQERAVRGLVTSLALCAAASGLCCCAAELIPGAMTGLFTTDEAVIQNGTQYLRTYALDIFLVAFVFCFNGFFAGCGHTRFTMTNCLLSTFLVRVPVVYVLSLLPGVSLLHIGIAAPAASLVQIVIQLIYYRRGTWKVNAVQKQG